MQAVTDAGVTHALEKPLGFGIGEILERAAAGEIDYHLVALLADLVLQRPFGIEYYPRVLRPRPYPRVRQIGRLTRAHGYRHRQGDQTATPVVQVTPHKPH